MAENEQRLFSASSGTILNSYHDLRLYLVGLEAYLLTYFGLFVRLI